MTATAFADVDASLKEIYSEDHRKSLAYVDNVLLATVGKEQSGGDYFVQAVRTRAPGGSSATYSKAKANNTASKIFKMNISRADLYQRVAINLNLFTAAKKSNESIYQITKEFDDGMKELGSKIERRLYRGKSGKIGQVASTTTVTGTTIVLTDKADAFNFQPGDKINVSTADGGGAVRTGGTLSGILTVLSVDEQAGTVTTAGANMSTEAGLASGDYIFQDGDYDACPNGLEDWLPVDSRTTKLATSFNGLTRSQDPNRLGGIYVDGTAVSGDLNDIALKLAGDMSKYGAKPELWILPTDQLTVLQQIWLAARIPYTPITVSASERMADGSILKISEIASGMSAQVGPYRMKVIGTRHCPSNRMYMLEPSTWTLRYTGGGVPFFATEEIEGSIMRLDTSGSTAPEVEAWLAAFCNLGCEAPGRNGVAKLPTAA